MKLSQQVAELEQRIQSLEYENERLKIITYRLIASNGNGFEPVPYSIEKIKMIKTLDFYLHSKENRITVSDKVEPNNSHSEL